MYLIIIAIFVVLFVYLPQFWVKSVLNKYNQQTEDNFPGNGGELARHLLDKYKLTDVKVEVTVDGDHYDPVAKAVRLTEDKFSGKTLTAITVAAHEVGHAIQHGVDMPLFNLRTSLAKKTIIFQRLGSFLLFTAPLLGLISRTPHTTLITFIAAFLVLGTSLLIHLITLPVELDASFNKALPILKNGYLEKSQHKAAERILKAAAWTYLAGAMVGLLNFWRWLQVLRR